MVPPLFYSDVYQLDITYLTCYCLISLGFTFPIMEALWHSFPLNFQNKLRDEHKKNKFPRELKHIRNLVFEHPEISDVQIIRKQSPSQVLKPDIDFGPADPRYFSSETFYSQPGPEEYIFRFNTEFEQLKFNLRITSPNDSYAREYLGKTIAFEHFDDAPWRIYTYDNRNNWVLISTNGYSEISFADFPRILNLFLRAYIEEFPFANKTHARINKINRELKTS